MEEGAGLNLLEFLFRRESAKAESIKVSGGAGTAALLEAPITIGFSPFTVGAEFDALLKEHLGVARYSLRLEEDKLDPLLIESKVVPPKLLVGVGPHNGTCPAVTGALLSVRSNVPSTLCSPCGVDCEFGAPMIRFPAMLNKEVCGAFTLCISGESREFENAGFLRAVSLRLSCELETAILRETNRLLEIIDSLTRVHNYRHFVRTLEQELERSRRYDHPFSMLLVDIAKLKSINSRYGFEIGDVILKDVAQLLKKSVRNTDSVARYSGGKFAIILTETDKEGAATVCAKIRNVIDDFSMPHPDQNHSIKIGANIGSATFPDDAALSSRLVLAVEDDLKHRKGVTIYDAPDTDGPVGK